YVPFISLSQFTANIIEIVGVTTWKDIITPTTSSDIAILVRSTDMGFKRWFSLGIEIIGHAPLVARTAAKIACIREIFFFGATISYTLNGPCMSRASRADDDSKYSTRAHSFCCISGYLFINCRTSTGIAMPGFRMRIKAISPHLENISDTFSMVSLSSGRSQATIVPSAISAANSSLGISEGSKVSTSLMAALSLALVDCETTE
uniref:Uncharacterized protein n=1 Tax=Glossina palpalis gambiensis TaxID=67801 RepID=A0A1B0AXD3_9MUSC